MLLNHELQKEKLDNRIRQLELALLDLRRILTYEDNYSADDMIKVIKEALRG
jgi:hypothetical protein